MYSFFVGTCVFSLLGTQLAVERHSLNSSNCLLWFCVSLLFLRWPDGHHGTAAEGLLVEPYNDG